MGDRYYGKSVVSITKYEKTVLQRRGMQPKPVFGITGEHVAQKQSVEEKRLDALLAIRRATGLPLDFWDELCQGLDNQALESMTERAEMSASYIKSRET